ncbi:MAG TPA: glutaredoxin family protein [Frankiaceae bacterium]|nr:glutaredoxin family protein [Frankiaceae bacterium]
MPDSRLVLLSRSGCHLCEDARAVLASVAGQLGVGWVERDVDASEALADEYGDRVPVVLLDGAEHCYWRVDESRLRAALAGQRRW